MCGLVGFFGGRAFKDDHDHQILIKNMSDTISHRGPDDAGYWSDVERQVCLGHRRLSIVDLSPAGHQPMHSPSGQYVMVFNGEIYNHLELRQRLKLDHSSRNPVDNGKLVISWRGHSDSETLLAGFDAWGIQGTIERTIGMFAIAVWDRHFNTLTLARDRLGEKPLYYGWQDDTFLFGSELKALRSHPSFKSDVDRDALCLLLRNNYIPAPYSIYKGIAKLVPGCILTVSLHQPEPNVITYWSGAQVTESGVANVFTGSPIQAVDELENLLKDAVRQQMMADVPLGAFLSGGIDSSTIVALMQAQSSRPVKTFTIGFAEEGYNEAVHAQAVARYLGTEHTELYVTPAQAMAVIPGLPSLYDEPFSDSSQIPTFLVSQLARQHVTVSLSGDAGDELFCGYGRYTEASNLWRNVSRIPPLLRKLAATGITVLSPEMWNHLSKTARSLLTDSKRPFLLGDKLHKGAMLLSSQTADELYRDLISHWRDPAALVIGGVESPTLLSGLTPELLGLNRIQRMMALDMLTYLPDDILVKVDRAAMGVSLETRVPFLDHRVVEFAWRLPQSMKMRDSQSKWALRQVLYRHLPKELIERPKMGFGIPLHHWLRSSLRDWAESLLDEKRLQREGYFYPAAIRQKWAEHLSGQRNWSYLLWDVLMFQAWLEENP